MVVRDDNLVSIYVALELMALASYVLAGYFKGETQVDRGGAQVLRARRVLLGRPPLRHLARLRRRRAARPAGDREGSSRASPRTTCSSSGSCCSSRGCSSRSRRCRSTSGRPTSTRARRRRSRRSSRSGRSSRPTRSSRASSTSPSRVPRGLGPHRGARLRGHDDLGQRRRAPADQRQAHARLLVDRARGLRAPRRPRVPDRHSASGGSSSTCSPTPS